MPGATAPAAGGAKRTYLEPDKQEPLRHRSPSPPRVTGAVTANRSRCHEPLQPIAVHSGLRAPSRPQPMGQSGRRALPPGPEPPPCSPPSRRGAADWPGPGRGRNSSQRPGGRAWTRIAGEMMEAWNRGLCALGPLPGLGGVLRSALLRCSPGLHNPLLPSQYPGLPRWDGTGGGRRRHRKLWEALLALAGKWPGRG